MSRLPMGLLLAIAVAATPAHASTKFRTAWKAEDAQPIHLEPGDSVLVMVIGARDDVRNGAEAALAAELRKRGAAAAPAYTVIPKSMIQDEEKARPYVEKRGCTYAITLRVVSQENEIKGSGAMLTAQPIYTGPYYGGLYGGYWTFGWGVSYNAGNIELDTHVKIETLVYDLKTNKLIWAGMTDTANPDSMLEFTRDLVGKIGKEMKKQGLVQK